MQVSIAHLMHLISYLQLVQACKNRDTELGGHEANTFRVKSLLSFLLDFNDILNVLSQSRPSISLGRAAREQRPLNGSSVRAASTSDNGQGANKENPAIDQRPETNVADNRKDTDIVKLSCMFSYRSMLLHISTITLTKAYHPSQSARPFHVSLFSSSHYPPSLPLTNHLLPSQCPLTPSPKSTATPSARTRAHPQTGPSTRNPSSTPPPTSPPSPAGARSATRSFGATPSRPS